MPSQVGGNEGIYTRSFLPKIPSVKVNEKHHEYETWKAVPSDTQHSAPVGIYENGWNILEIICERHDDLMTTVHKDEDEAIPIVRFENEGPNGDDYNKLPCELGLLVATCLLLPKPHHESSM